MKFENHIELVVKSGDTGEILHTYTQSNAISDDFLANSGHIYINESLNGFPAYGEPWCFLLPDGVAWTGFSWDRTNPWAPYCTTLQRYQDRNVGVNAYYQSKTYTAPFGSGNPTPKHKLFYQWTALPQDIALKAIGLTALQEPTYGAGIFGIFDPPDAQPGATFVPETLVILPSAINVRGRNAVGGVPTQTPDILEVSYYLSIVGVS